MDTGSIEVDLRTDALLAEASAIVGNGNFGSGFRGNLEALVAMYDTTAGLTPKGRKVVRKRLVELLANRAVIEEAFEKHPEARTRSIRRPVFVVGLPRTGTSAYFNLLAVDPASRPLLFWEGRHPNPAEGLAPGEADPRVEAVRTGLEIAYARNPDFAKIHQVRADGPEECVMLLAHTMGSVQMGVEPLISPYREYFEAQDQRANYAYYRDLLSLLDWQRPGERWLLKSPAHLWALDVLLELFPDACIVWAHRNPVEAIASYCSMIEALSGLRRSVERASIGPAVLEHLARSVDRAMSVRADAPPHRFFDVRYADFIADPLGMVEATYRAFGLDLEETTRHLMRQHVVDRPKDRHGEHRYTLEQFGLSAADVGRRFASYSERFGVPMDAR